MHAISSDLWQKVFDAGHFVDIHLTRTVTFISEFGHCPPLGEKTTVLLNVVSRLIPVSLHEVVVNVLFSSSMQYVAF